jgi:4-amino-4-deoxy-L-arabinose transferase-like glycosyltransferase
LKEVLASLRQPWVLAVFTLALVSRVAFALIVDQPLLYAHQLHYFTNGLLIAEHPHPFAFVLHSDRWRTWNQHWTIAPLYYIFEGVVFRLFGPHLKPLVLLQCLLGALTAVATGIIGREVAGPRGFVAGIVYAFYAHAVELPSWTLTENLHNVLFTVALAVILKTLRRPGFGFLMAGAFLLGLAALARSVSSAFIPVVAVWYFCFAGPLVRWRRTGVLLLCALAAILPWTARNFLLGEHVVIETNAFFNIWKDNNFTTPSHLQQQTDIIASQPTAADRNAAALRFALHGIQRHPERVLEKSRVNFWHYLRPEGLHYLLAVEGSIEPWRHAFTVIFEDGIILPLLPLFLVFVLAGRRSPGWALILLWTGYVLFFMVVVFENEVPRYRSALVPFALAGGVEGARTLLSSAGRRRPLSWLGLALGLGLTVTLVKPYAPLAGRAISALLALRPARAALDHGDLASASVLAAKAAAEDPGSARPFLNYGRELAFAGHTEEAIEAYKRGAERASVVNFRPVLALSRLFQDAGLRDLADRAQDEADTLSWGVDPWVVLEIAWRELPPPRTDEIRLGQGDYGAVRGFLHPRGVDPRVMGSTRWVDLERFGGSVPPGRHRWSLHRAFIRLVPTQRASSYDLTLYMGSPYPSVLTNPVVTVRVGGREEGRFTQAPEIRPYRLRVAAPPGGELLLELEAPSWNRGGEPAEQAIRVDRLTVTPTPGAR